MGVGEGVGGLTVVISIHTFCIHKDITIKLVPEGEHILCILEVNVGPGEGIWSQAVRTQQNQCLTHGCQDTTKSICDPRLSGHNKINV